MFELIKKAMLTGVGLAAMTKDKLDELAKELSEKGKLSEQEGKDLAKDLFKKAEEARNKLEVHVEELVEKAIKKTNLVTRDELSKLREEVDKLKQALDEKEMLK